MNDPQSDELGALKQKLDTKIFSVLVRDITDYLEGRMTLHELIRVCNKRKASARLEKIESEKLCNAIQKIENLANNMREGRIPTKVRDTINNTMDDILQDLES